MLRRRRKNKLWCLVLLALLVPILVYSYAEGPPSGVTGGFGEPTCVDCHTGTPLNGGGGKVTITAPQSYSSGVTYPIAVTVFDSVQRRWDSNSAPGPRLANKRGR